MSLFQRDGWLLGFPTPFLLFVKEDWINTLQNCSLLTLAKWEESLALSAYCLLSNRFPLY